MQALITPPCRIEIAPSRACTPPILCCKPQARVPPVNEPPSLQGRSIPLAMSECVCQWFDETDLCQPAWLEKGWRCPYSWRPKCEELAPGDVVILDRRARMWTGWPGDPTSIVYRSDVGGDRREYLVEEVRVHRDHTTIQTTCQQIVSMTVYVRTLLVFAGAVG